MDYYMNPQTQLVSNTINYNTDFYYLQTNNSIKDITIMYWNTQASLTNKLQPNTSIYNHIYNTKNKPTIIIFSELRKQSMNTYIDQPLEGYYTTLIPARKTTKNWYSGGFRIDIQKNNGQNWIIIYQTAYIVVILNKEQI
jgi:hypothetical protein